MKADANQFFEWLAAREGAPYLWGGRGDLVSTATGLAPAPYEGWDCWGLVADGLFRSGGPDWRRWWTDKAWAELPAVATPSPGCVAFWAPNFPTHPNDVEHVEVVLGPSLDGKTWRTYGASGGRSTTVTLEDAHKHGAKVKFRDSHLSRSRFAGFRALPLTHAA